MSTNNVARSSFRWTRRSTPAYTTWSNARPCCSTRPRPGWQTHNDRSRVWPSSTRRPAIAAPSRFRPVHLSITCDTVTNVRLTYREIQETILLDFRIERAGIRQIVFRLPAWLRDAQVTAPMIRQQTIEAVAGKDEVRVTLDLQDAMTVQYRVVIENDRVVTPDQQSAPLAWIETGTTNSALRDPGKRRSRRSSRWRIDRL